MWAKANGSEIHQESVVTFVMWGAALRFPPRFAATGGFLNWRVQTYKKFLNGERSLVCLRTIPKKSLRRQVIWGGDNSLVTKDIGRPARICRPHIL
jgi:hypothetical protein